jgi:hypothetical protein
MPVTKKITINTVPEMFNSPDGNISGYKVNSIDFLGFNCFIGEKTLLDNRYALYDEMSGLILVYISQNLEYSFKIVENALRKKEYITDIVQQHNNSITEGKILPKFKKEIKIIYRFDNKIGKSDINSKKEYIHNFVKKFDLQKHFFTITNHVNVDFCQPDTCYICCGNMQIPKPSSTDIIKFKVNDVPCVDIFDIAPPRYKGNTSTGKYLEVEFGNKVFSLGIYLPEMNVLYISDVSHVNDFEWIKEIMEYCKKNLFIKNNIDNDGMKLTIGADPEFELHWEGRNICENDLHTGNRLLSKIGSDGSNRQMELRPSPKNSPEEAIDEIESILDSISYHKIICDGDIEPLGGHIHFGLKENGISMRLLPSTGMIQALDKFLGEKVLPLNGKARTSNGYGKLTDWREQPWGFEYRTPPSGIFFNKEMAYICYKIAYNIVKYLIDNESISVCGELSAEDYIKYANLTTDQYEYFIRFVSIFNKERKNSIVDNWIKNKKSNPISIVFYDEWDEKIKEEIRKRLLSSVVLKPIKIVLYGINEKHGTNVCSGAGHEIGKIINHTNKIHCTEGIAIGVGKSFRGSLPISHINSLVNDIKLKIGIANASNEEPTTFNLFVDEVIGRSKISNQGGYSNCIRLAGDL